MSKVNINYAGWIDSKEKWRNLTWSQTIFSVDFWKTKTPTIVVDAWAIQWVKKANDLNKIINDWVLNSDFLVITHAHADHAGLVPYLVKKWYSGRIIMTELTKLQSQVMWLDYVNLTKNEIEKMKELNAKLSKRLHEALQIVHHYEEITQSKKSTNKVKASEKYLAKVVENKSHLEAYQESLSILKEYWVESEKDISSVLQEVPFLLFDEEDVEKTLAKIETFEKWENLELQNHHPISSGKDPLIDKLPAMVKNWYQKAIPVLTALKGTVVSKLIKMWENTQKLQSENKQMEEANNKLTEQIQLALNFVEFAKEKSQNLEDFEKKYGTLVKVDDKKIREEIKSLETITLNWEEFNVWKLLDIYASFDFKLPTKYNDYISLSSELDELGIHSLQDIERHLPELPEEDYEHVDIRKWLKNAFTTTQSEVTIHDYVAFIENVDTFSIQEILNIFKSGKKVFIKKSIVWALRVQLLSEIEKNLENHRKNQEIKETLQNAYDLVQMYEGDSKLYIQNNADTYRVATKFVNKFKFEGFQDIYQVEELDDLLDITYENIPKQSTIIHIKRLDDSRIFDVLFSKNNNIIYYFEPKIRERIKEKLSDYIWTFQAKKADYKRRLATYNDYLNFIKIYEGKASHNISESEYNTAKKLLENHNISSLENIENFYIFETFTSYTQKDIDAFLQNTTEVGDDFDVNQIGFTYIDSAENERIFDIPYHYDNASEIFVIQESAKEEIKKKLILAKWDYFKTLSVRRKKRAWLREKFELLQNYDKNFQYLFALEWYENVWELITELHNRRTQIGQARSQIKKIEFARLLQEKLSQWWEVVQSEYENTLAFLKSHNIKSIDDLPKVLQQLHNIEYDYADVQKAISLLKWVHIDKNSDILESLKLRFVDAGHLEWSVQVVITAVVSEVDKILNKWKSSGRKLKHTNYALSGDLWRVNDPNLSGSPEEIPYALDYYQVESTYAWREHIDKAISTKKLFESISAAKGKILIPAFSMQRTQEILMVLLEKRLEWQQYIQQIKNLSKEKQGIITDITKTSSPSLRSRYEDQIARLDLQIQYLQTKVCDYDIIVDSPTSEAITEIYINNCWEKYDLLNPKTQIELFGKEVIIYVKQSQLGENNKENRVTLEEIYSETRRNKKEIILSASGMADGWSILPHLKENLQNADSKIIFVGYCPISTRGGKIKAWDEFISIDGEAYAVECEFDDITGFSGHIDEKEIITYLSTLKFKKWALIALTHGDEKRIWFAKRIEDAMKKVWHKVKVVVPQLGETRTMKL